MTEQSNRPAAVATLQEDNDRVRITEYRFAPGAETTRHVHEWDYVVVSQTNGLLLIAEPDGTESNSELTQGISYYRRAGVDHNVINAGAEELVFIEIELKAHPIEDN